VDGKSAVSDQPVDLPAGKHTIIVKLDARRLPDHVRLTASDGTFLVE
jgi:hypothetical protein